MAALLAGDTPVRLLSLSIFPLTMSRLILVYVCLFVPVLVSQTDNDCQPHTLEKLKTDALRTKARVARDAAAVPVPATHRYDRAGPTGANADWMHEQVDELVGSQVRIAESIDAMGATLATAAMAGPQREQMERIACALEALVERMATPPVASAATGAAAVSAGSQVGPPAAAEASDAEVEEWVFTGTRKRSRKERDVMGFPFTGDI